MTTRQPLRLLRREWTAFRSPGRLVATAAAALIVVALGLLQAFGNHASCSGGPCPAEPVGPDGSAVTDQFAFLHRDLAEHGSITVRLTSMTGTITYPPPHHDTIVAGLVPWAKTGIIIKDGVRPGSSYAALMVTGGHGVRMQYDYAHDVAGPGSEGAVSAGAPRWLRLTRSGDSVTGLESADGRRWAEVGTARLPGLPATAQVGLFATSPGDLTLRPTGLGGATEERRFTQAGGVFDHVGLTGAAGGGWRADTVGVMNTTDWEKYHRASGAVEQNGVFTVTGTGDIAPGRADGGDPVTGSLGGVVFGLLVVLVVAVRFGALATTRGELAAKAVVVGVVTFLTGAAAAGAVVPAGVAVLKRNGIPVAGLSPLTGVRVVIGTAVLLALAAVLALALGALLRRAWSAVLLAALLIVVPYAVTSVPLLPDAPAQWLLRLTPAAGFAVRQTVIAHPQVLAHYAPSAGYFPLPWWAGLAVLGAYAAAFLWLAATRRARRPVAPGAAAGLT